MIQGKIIVFGTALWLAGASPAPAQTSFQTYRCADGSEFMVGFFPPDRRAHLQIDGKAVTLGKGLSVLGSRYSGSGVTLTMAKAGVRIKHAKRPATACDIY